jgi:hypothetical protein
MADTSGPIFNASAEVDKMLRDIENAIAQRGLELVQANLAGSLRHPTGYYQSHINVRREETASVVNDTGDVIYNYWLEGTGSRNSPVTRFPGYFSFQRAQLELDAQAIQIATPVVEQFVAEMNA